MSLQPVIDDLRARIRHHADQPIVATAIPNLSFSVVSEPGTGVAGVHVPMACLILQGSKRITVGDVALDCDSASYFLASLDVPAMGQIGAATPATPFVGAGLELDRAVLAELIAQMPPDAGEPAGGERLPSFGLAPITGDLLAAWAGLVALLDRPEDIAVLAPLREREILFRLLQGPLSGQLRQMARDDSHVARIRRAIGWIRDHHTTMLRIEALADVAGMSVSSFHRHFRAATALSPLQYQKTVRLHAARRMLAAGSRSGEAAYSVGYESVPQFSREYRRTFGISPAADADRLSGRELGA